VSRARIRVVGLGPGDARYVTAGTTRALDDAAVARLRTRVHPAAASWDIESYDEFYEVAGSFDELYARIVEDLVALATASADHEVVYAVPGSPVVAERTVELLRERGDVDVVCEPAVSVIDVACAALGLDPMARGLRIVDALDSAEPLRGPGPLLVLQTYSPEVLAGVADRLPGDTPVDVLYHLGLDDERIVRTRARDLTGFVDADHLTSLYVDGLRTAGEAMDDLVDFTRRLRQECPWDQEQTHASLARYLLEESYEALDAVTSLAAMDELGEEDETIVDHAQEELGDLLFQVLFHAELGQEEGRFNLASIADAARDKLTSRHPHVFGDVVVTSADDVAANWEAIKKVEKGRASALDGISWSAPSLDLHAKVLHRARALDVAPAASEALEALRDAVAALTLPGPEGRADLARDTRDSDEAVRAALAVALEMLSALATRLDVHLEGVLRERVVALAREIRGIETTPRVAPEVGE
jgi:tetrapyrrole methylase family protein / MazG family protein